jgi:hypothetical protein
MLMPFGRSVAEISSRVAAHEPTARSRLTQQLGALLLQLSSALVRARARL